MPNYFFCEICINQLFFIFREEYQNKRNKKYILRINFEYIWEWPEIQAKLGGNELNQLVWIKEGDSQKFQFK